MGEVTGISWTDHTFSPWEGCLKVSVGCDACYAEARNERFNDGAHWGPPATTPRLLRSPNYWKQPERWNREALKAGVRRRVFCSSLSDVFEDHPGVVADRIRLFSLIERTPALDWQLLTKRPENMARLAPRSWETRWPDNVWAGTTAENAEMLARRAPYLRQIPARVRFLSCEPLLGPLDNLEEELAPEMFALIHWVIAGGESGPRARPFDMMAARQIVGVCDELGVACFVKQMGDNPIDGAAGVQLGRDGVHAFKAHHGADPAEWPEDLRVQQFPREAVAS